VVVTSKQLREFNGVKLGEEICLHRPEGDLVVKVRRVGPAGILVRGFASVFRWEDEGGQGMHWNRIVRRRS